MREVTRIKPQVLSGAYPLNQVISIMPTEKEGITAFESLIANGFMESEVSLGSGPELADRIRATSGRPGLVGRILEALDGFGQVATR